MPQYVVVASPKGGAGRTTLVCQLAAHLTAAGTRCMAIDLDPQNAMGLYLGHSPEAWVTSSGGLAKTVGVSWDDVGVSQLELKVQTLVESLRARHARVAHLPFGQHDVARRRRVERELASHAPRLREHLEQLSPPRCELLLLDTPAGCNTWTDSALELADLVLVPVVADPATFAVLPSFEAYLRTRVGDVGRAFYVVNRFDPTSQLACDVVDALAGTLPGRVIDEVIHDDAVLGEQLARGTPLLLEGASQIAADLESLSRFVAQRVQENRMPSEAHAP